MLLFSTDARQTTDYTSEKCHARAFSTRSLVALLATLLVALAGARRINQQQQNMREHENSISQQRDFLLPKIWMEDSAYTRLDSSVRRKTCKSAEVT